MAFHHFNLKLRRSRGFITFVIAAAVVVIFRTFKTNLNVSHHADSSVVPVQAVAAASESASTVAAASESASRDAAPAFEVPLTSADPAATAHPGAATPCDAPPQPGTTPIAPPKHPLLAEYVSWHARERDRAGQPGGAPALVFTCPRTSGCAGLGDRLRGLRVAYLLALATRRVLFVDLPNVGGYAFEVGMGPALVDWRLPQRLRDEHAARPMPLLDWWHCREAHRECIGVGHFPNMTTLPGPDNVGVDFDMLHDDVAEKLASYPVVALSTRNQFMFRAFEENSFLNRTLSGVPAIARGSVGSAAFHRGMLASLFSPTKLVFDAIRDVGLSLAGGSPPVYAVHARLGEDFGEGDEERFQYYNSHQAAFAKELLRCVILAAKNDSSSYDGKSALRIYISSDSQRFKRVFAAEAAKAQVSSSSHVYDGPALHAAREFQGNPSDSCSAFLGVFVDLFYLGHSRASVVTGSGFSYAAISLGNTTYAPVMHSSLDERSNRCTLTARHL